MQKKTIPCKACGKPFVPCSTVTAGFNYKTVACSEACGKEYFRMIEESRSGNKSTPKVEKVTEEASVELPEIKDVAVEEPKFEIAKPKKKKFKGYKQYDKNEVD